MKPNVLLYRPLKMRVTPPRLLAGSPEHRRGHARRQVDGGNLTQICADTASWSTLRSHPLIDSDLATRIVRYRAQHVLNNPSELGSARTISQEELEGVLPYLTFCQPLGEAN